MYLCRALLRLFGWRLVMNLPPERKFIMTAAWHTSNWDFPLTVLAAGGMGLPLKYLGKQELIDGKLGWLLSRMGVIGIDRTPGSGVVEQVASLFAAKDQLMLAVAPEGTRGVAGHWGTGFYYMALAASVPIVFGFLDGDSKRIGIDGYFKPSGKRQQDLQIVKDYYENLKSLKPEKQGSIVFKELRPPEDSEA